MRELPRLGGDGWELLYLDGEWETREDRLAVEDPYEREELVSVSAASEETVDEAYEVAAEAQTEWEEAPPQERAAVIQNALEVIEERHEELVELLAREAGGTRLKAEVELDTATGMMELAASFPLDSPGQHDRSVTPGKENIVKREPVGVVGVISPWNFPFHLSMRARSRRRWRSATQWS
ncbi:lactaldehyde dehydrogenase [Halalkalicoccus paucihalophilus]|uniref:Lactaldehyde dehydrogenase n=1 Tax=Halalkalicoccus paucihalophilus TaxID=1008153 RepID=A0A151ADE0_9EURY|nr:lactaldehyde dehydrogenase [Halalkalicoccus paucihalophilus]